MVTQNTQNTIPPITTDHISPPFVDYTYYPYGVPQTIGLVGWICPKCNKGISPFQTTCPCASQPMRVTCAVGGNNA